ncbi:hypothetical protein F5Y15DRAFT_135785 [Xylariaceae sp. FL0016]|nr:hypothetical protein F5Y15DRAFT_135785 [Xylariaceae sp. FL0016]
MKTTKTQRMATVDTLLAGYDSLYVPCLLQPLSADFQHQVLPKSLGMPARDRESFAKHAAGIFGIFDSFRMVPISVVDDGSTGMVVVHARMHGVLKGAQMEWLNECIMMIRLSEDGTEVHEISEFVDSAKAREMAQKHAPKEFGGSGGSPRNEGGTGRAEKVGLMPVWISSSQVVALGVLLYLASTFV